MSKRQNHGGPLDFAGYKSPQQAFDGYKEVNGGVPLFSLKQLKTMAANDSLCFVCESMPVWRMAGLGMCFTCTTGESDASNDYELELIK